MKPLRSEARQLISRTLDRLDLVRDGLRRFGEEYDLAGPPDTYVFAGRSLVNQRVLDENPELQATVNRVDGKVESVVLPFSAREVFLRTHARIFGLYLSPGVTAKVGLSLRKERSARRVLARHLADSPHVRIPAIYGHGKSGRWLVEEFIEGEWATLADLEAFLTGGAARDFYGATARVRAIGRRPWTAALLQELAELDPVPGIPADARLPMAIVHGDLNPTNLMRAPDGRFHVVDIDKARVAPIAMDLAKIYVRRPNLRGVICDFLRGFDPTGTSLPVEQQIALGIVHRSRMLRKRGDPVNRVAETLAVKETLAAIRSTGSRMVLD